LTISDLPRPLAFVLSGGGSYGAVQVGMLRALDEANIRPDLVVGTSVGALNGAVLASQDVGKAIAAMEDIWAQIDRKTVFGGGLIRTAVNFARKRTSAFNPERLADLINEHLPVDTFDQLIVPFGAVATNGITGEVVLLRSGPIRPVLLASSAIPGVFPAVEHDHQRLVDGGIAANLPVRQAFEMGAASVITLDAMPMRSTMPTGPSSGVMQSVAIMFRNQHSATPDADAGPVVRLPIATPDNLNSLDFGRSTELIDAGHAVTSVYIASGIS